MPKTDQTHVDAKGTVEANASRPL